MTTAAMEIMVRGTEIEVDIDVSGERLVVTGDDLAFGRRPRIGFVAICPTCEKVVAASMQRECGVPKSVAMWLINGYRVETSTAEEIRDRGWIHGGHEGCTFEESFA